MSIRIVKCDRIHSFRIGDENDNQLYLFAQIHRECNIVTEVRGITQRLDVIQTFMHTHF